MLLLQAICLPTQVANGQDPPPSVLWVSAALGTGSGQAKWGYGFLGTTGRCFRLQADLPRVHMRCAPLGAPGSGCHSLPGRGNLTFYSPGDRVLSLVFAPCLEASDYILISLWTTQTAIRLVAGYANPAELADWEPGGSAVISQA